MSDTDTQETAPVNTDEAAPTTPLDGADQTVETEATTEPAPAGDETQTDAEKVETFDKAYVEKLRREAQKLRAKAKEDAEKASKEAAEAAEKALTERLGKALGLIQDDTPVDPQELIAQAAEREAQALEREAKAAAKLRAYELEKALTNAANKVDGDLDILTPYLRGTGALDALDPDADDYLDQVSAVVAAAVEQNPKLKKVAPVAAPARSGGDISNGTGIPKKGPESVDDIRANIRKKRGF